MDPTAQDPSSILPSQDQARPRRNERRRAMQQSKRVARESQKARHVEDTKSPTHGEDKGAASTTNVPFSRGRDPNRPNRPASSEELEITRARAALVPTSRSQQASPTRDRSLNAISGRADNISSNFVPTANQVRPNATTTSQQPLKIETTISKCIATDNATQININLHFINCPEESKMNCLRELNCMLDLKLNNPRGDRQCIRDLKLNNPRWDRADIEKRHGVVCDEHLQKVCEHKSYKRWKNDDETRLLWIYTHKKQTANVKMDFKTGDQKRIVAGAVAKDLEQSLMIRDNALSYMFCQNSRDPEKLNDTAAILRGLMWLLSLTQESLTACLEETYNREGKSMYTDEYAKGALSDILLGWLKDTNIGRVYLVVGAIDECYIEREDILEFLDLIIMRCKGLAKVKWLITSDCDDIYIDWIKFKLGPDDRSFETIHLNERSKSLHDPSFETLPLNKKRQSLHDPSFETLHLNKRTNMGSKARRRARTAQRKREEAIARDTRGTDQKMKRGGAGSAQGGERNLDKRRGSQ